MFNAYATRIEPVKDCADVSFFQTVENLWQGKECQEFPLHRFFTLMRKAKAKSFVTEELLPNKELKDEQDMATSRCGGQVRIAKAIRLTFFASLPPSGRWNDESELPNNHLTGYAVILTLDLPTEGPRTFLLEAVTRGPIVWFSGDDVVFDLEVPNYYVHIVKTQRTCLGIQKQNQNREFTIKGTFFTQQNNLTSVCGHAALRMAVNSSPFLSELLLAKKGTDKLTNMDINNILEIDFSGPNKTVGEYTGDPDPTKGNEPLKGIYRKQIATVVEHIGAKLITSSFIEDASVEYDQVLYPVMESGYPVILEVQGWDIKEGRDYAHAVAVTGHTLTTDRWEPEAKYGYGNYPIRPYIPVSEWVCHYIMSDDNFGMDVALPSNMVKNDMVPVKNPKLHATSVLSLLPKQVSVTAHRAETIAMDIATQLIRGTDIHPTQYWMEKLKERDRRKSLVCRTILLRDKEYRAYIKKLSEMELIDPTSAQRKRLRALPRYIWVTEVTIPNLYTGNKAKLADVVVSASATAKSLESGTCFIFGWFPGFIRFGLKPPSEPWYLKRHVPLIAIQSKLLDW